MPVKEEIVRRKLLEIEQAVAKLVAIVDGRTSVRCDALVGH